MSIDTGTFFWMEHYSRDVKAATAFYAKTAGWEFDVVRMSDEMGDYTIARAGDKQVAGFLDLVDFEGMDPTSSIWLSYIAVEDVDGVVAKAEQAGGRILKRGFDVPGVGRMAIILDASGAIVAVMTPSDP